ncbi:MAG TPA: YncE family protein [Bryobacteraceae bacterium]|nr:YncE family protein [Bryobacteraceae bacterium]
MRGGWRGILWVFTAAAGFAQPPAQKVVQDGVAVEFETESGAGSAASIRSRSDVRFRFRISDTASGNPLQSLRPAAWLDIRRGGQPADTQSCTRKVASFLGDSLLSIPSLDLNAWYVLAMNEDATISVVNPRFGFGGSQLLTQIDLDSPASDWVLTDDQQRLFVSMPASDRVAVVDLTSWKVIARLEVPSRPERIALEPGERLLWVSYRDGVAAFDRQSLKPAARIPTSAGPHELAFSPDRSLLFMTNSGGGTVSVIDTAAAQKIADVPTGAGPSSIAFSVLSRVAYAAIREDGGIVAVDSRGGIVARIPTDPGIRQLRASPDGRFVFAVNPAKERLYIVDASSNRLVQTAVIHGGPDQVTFTNTLAYIRRRSDATVLMVPLAGIGVADAPLPLVDFTGGHLPFSKGSLPSPADSIVSVPGANAVLVANPADRAVYYYQEGMAAPMGQFQNYGHEPRAVMVADRGLEEGPRGVYQTTGRVPRAGKYDVVFFLDSPRLVHCFELDVAPAPDEPAGPKPVIVRSAVSAGSDMSLQAGESATVRFQVLDASTQQPIARLADLRALVFLLPGVWQTRQAAVETAPGIYEIQFTPPSTGTYQAYFESSSLGLKFNSPHALTFIARDRTGKAPR